MNKAELECRLADLDAELNEVQAAKASADDRTRELEQKVVTLEGKVMSFTSDLQLAVKDRDLLVSKSWEELRKELGWTKECEIKTHQELQCTLYERIADKERVIADLQAQLDRDASTRGEALGGDEPTRVKMSWTLKLPALPVFDGGDKVDDGA